MNNIFVSVFEIRAESNGESDTGHFRVRFILCLHQFARYNALRVAKSACDENLTGWILYEYELWVWTLYPRCHFHYNNHEQVGIKILFANRENTLPFLPFAERRAFRSFFFFFFYFGHFIAAVFARSQCGSAIQRNLSFRNFVLEFETFARSILMATFVIWAINKLNWHFSRRIIVQFISASQRDAKHSFIHLFKEEKKKAKANVNATSGAIH